MTTHSLDDETVGNTTARGGWKGVQGPLLQIGALAVPFVAHLYYPLPCPMKMATGLDCPGCGGTRAAAAAVHGDLQGALNLNALVIFLPVLVVMYLLARRFRPDWQFLRIDPFWLLMAVLGVWMVLRNIPGLDALRAVS